MTRSSRGYVSPAGSIRPCTSADFDSMLAVINAASIAYRGLIPDDCWHEPYMPARDLAREIAADIGFSVYERDHVMLGVMGTQNVQDVTLIRHAYVSPVMQRAGVGSALLTHLCSSTDRPVLIGTWSAAIWAVRFYEKHGFRMIGGDEKNALLKKYWTVPARQMDMSVVLADARWPRD